MPLKNDFQKIIHGDFEGTDTHGMHIIFYCCRKLSGHTGVNHSLLQKVIANKYSMQMCPSRATGGDVKHDDLFSANFALFLGIKITSMVFRFNKSDDVNLWMYQSCFSNCNLHARY